jgi:hypothetical protein
MMRKEKREEIDDRNSTIGLTSCLAWPARLTMSRRL